MPRPVNRESLRFTQSAAPPECLRAMFGGSAKDNGFILEGQDGVQNLLAITRLLDIGNLSPATVSDTGLGDF